MIRLSAALVVVAIGVLVGGVAASSLLLVYVAIGVSALALLVLGLGVALKRDEFFGDDTGATGTAADHAVRVHAASGAPFTGTPGTGTGTGQLGSGQQSASDGETRVPAAAIAFGSEFSDEGAFAEGAEGAERNQGSAHQGSAHQGSGLPPREAAAPPWDASQAATPAADWAPGAWRSPESAPDETRSLFTPASRRRAPSAPPTRADPVLPWSDSLPTRADIGGNPPEPVPVPDWLGDVDEGEAGREGQAGPPAAQTTPVEQAAGEDLVDSPDAEGGGDSEALTAEAPTAEAPTAEAATAEDAGAVDLDEASGPVETDDAADSGSLADESGDSSDGLVDEPAVASAEPDGSPDAGATASASAATGSRRVSVVPGVPRYHVEDCILIRFMDDEDVQHTSVAEAEKSGCTPCRACFPED